VSTYTDGYDTWGKFPGNLTVDPNGNIYVAWVGSANLNTKLSGSLSLINSVSTSYNGYWGITTLSTGDIVVTDCPMHGYNPPIGNNRIVKMDSNFNIIATFGSTAGSDTSHLYSPGRLASDRFGNIYVITCGGTGDNPARLVKLSSDLNYVGEYRTNFDNDSSIDVKGDYVYIASYSGEILKVLDLNLNETGRVGRIGTFGVHDIAIDKNGYIWAATNSNITLLDSDFNIISVFDSDPWHKDVKEGIAIDQDGSIFISHRYKGVAKLHYTATSVTLISPNTSANFSKGSTVTISWNASGALPTDSIAISMKRSSVPDTQTEPDGVNWYRLTDNTPNDGSEPIVIPTSLAEASDWRFFVKHSASGSWDSSDGYITVVSSPAVQITLTAPNAASTYAKGSQVLIQWNTVNAAPSDSISISMKRSSVPDTQTAPDGVNWYRFTDITPTLNDGSETITIPAGVAEASDWRFFIGHVTSGVWAASTSQFSVTPQPPSQYSLNVSASNGTVNRNPNNTSYASGSIVTLTASPNSCYEFSGWAGNCASFGMNTTCTLTMDSNKSVSANFTAKTFFLDVSAYNGTVNRTPNQTSYACGSNVTLTASPNSCYEFSGWSGNCSGFGINTSCNLTMDSNKSAGASFSTGTYSLNITAVNGTVNRNPNNASYACGTSVSLTPMPNTGYQFDHWVGNISGVQSNTAYVTMNQNMNVTAVFVPTINTATAFRVWIDKDYSKSYNAGEEVADADVFVNRETTPRGKTDSYGIVRLENIRNEDKIYAYKQYYQLNNPKADDSNFGGSGNNPYSVPAVNRKMYSFAMASDIMQPKTGDYYDFPGQGKTLQDVAKDTQGNMLVQLVHPRIEWNLVVAFETAQSEDYYDKIKVGLGKYADYMYNYTDGYVVVKNVVLVKGTNAYIDSAQWNYCDMQIHNKIWPHANAYGNRYNENRHIYMSKFFDGKEELNTGEPSNYNWYSTVGHESGHYLLGFGDEYMNGDYSKGDKIPWAYRTTHDGDDREPNEFPKDYGVMDSHYNGVHEMSDPTDYFPRTYSPTLDVDLATNQWYYYEGQSCWTYFKSDYQNDIKQHMDGQGFSDAFFNNLIIPPHTSGSYPGWNSDKRPYPTGMIHDTLNIIEWTPPNLRSREAAQIFDAIAMVKDETGSAVANADVWLISSDRKSFQGKSDKNGIVSVGSLSIGKSLEAYFNGRKAEVMIDTVRESYFLTLPANRVALRDDGSAGMVISAKPDSSNPKRLTITASGSSLSSVPVVILSQSHGYSVSVAMSSSGVNQYSGIADCQYDSGILQVSSGASQSVSPFEIFTTEVGPASGYYSPNGELEMAYTPGSFTGSGSFVIMNSSAPAPPNNGLIQVGNVYGFGFSSNISAVKDLILSIRLPSGVNKTQLNLYGWDIQNKTWTLIPGGFTDQHFFSIFLDSVYYTSYAVFATPQATDLNPPNPVTGFITSTGTSRWSVNLQWTAPSDNVGVFAYDIRFNTVPITESNWGSSLKVGSVPKPTEPGTSQNMIIEMPDPNTVYYFGIKATDAADNVSALTVSSAVKSQAIDTDGDGMPDFWEIDNGLNPNVNDALNDNDGDGLTNIQEYQYHTDPKNKDTDGDGYLDGDEVAQKTDPTDSKSHLNLSSTTSGDLDCDDNVTLSDTIIALRIVSGIDPPSVFCKNDVNGDNKIGLEEVVYILQKVAGLR